MYLNILKKFPKLYTTGEFVVTHNRDAILLIDGKLGTILQRKLLTGKVEEDTLIEYDDEEYQTLQPIIIKLEQHPFQLNFFYALYVHLGKLYIQACCLKQHVDVATIIEVEFLTFYKLELDFPEEQDMLPYCEDMVVCVSRDNKEVNKIYPLKNVSLFFVLTSIASVTDPLDTKSHAQLPWSIHETVSNGDNILLSSSMDPIEQFDKYAKYRRISSNGVDTLVFAEKRKLVVFNFRTGERAEESLDGYVHFVSCQTGTTEEDDGGLKILVGLNRGKTQVIAFDRKAEKFSVSTNHWHSKTMLSGTISPDGLQIVTGGEEAVVVTWQANDLNNRSYIPRLNSPIIGLVMNSDGTRHYALSKEGVFFVISAEKKAIENTAKSMHLKYIPLAQSEEPIADFVLAQTRLAYKYYLITNTTQRTLTFYETFTGKSVYELNVGARNFVSHTSFYAYNLKTLDVVDEFEREKLLFTTEANYRKNMSVIKVWKLSKHGENLGCELVTLVQEPHDTHIHSSSLSPDKSLYMTCAISGEVKIWKRKVVRHDTESRLELLCVSGLFAASLGRDVAFSVKKHGNFFIDNTVVAIGNDRRINVYALDGKTPCLDLVYGFDIPVDGDEPQITQVQFMEDCPILVICVKYQGLFLMDFLTRHVFFSIEDEGVTGFALLNSIIYLASFNDVVLYEYCDLDRSVEELSEVKLRNRVSKFTLGLAGTLIISLTPSGKLCFMDMKGKERALFSNITLPSDRLFTQYFSEENKEQIKYYELHDTRAENMEKQKAIGNIDSGNIPSMTTLLQSMIEKI